jgi:hypothetical protein
MSRMLSKSKLGHWIVALAVGMLITCVWCRSVRADVFTPTLHSDLQAVDDLGTSAWSGQPGDKISLIGMLINNPWDMLNSSSSASQPQWQVFIQAVAPGDFGGTAVYMRMNNPWNSAQNYTALEWYQEMERVNYPGQSTAPLQRGDLIRVDARTPGMFYGGKYNINEMHFKDPANNFDISILDRGLTPQATLIDLSYLKDSLNNFIFDETRATGGEHYQGSLVHLDNLILVDDPSNWVLDGTVTVRQGDLTMPLKLGLHPELLSIAPTAETPFSINAILDQETPGGGPFTGSYRLWLTNANDFSVVPEPGTFVLLALGGLLMFPVVRRRVWPRES